MRKSIIFLLILIIGLGAYYFFHLSVRDEVASTAISVTPTSPIISYQPSLPTPTSTSRILGFSSVTIGSQTYKVEVARSEAEMERGLMNRKYLDPNTGMIFVFQNASPQNFWNENTLLSLDVVWIFNNKVTGVSFLPEISKGLTTVTSPTSVDYVLELPAGTAARNGIHIGSKAEITIN